MFPGFKLILILAVLTGPHLTNCLEYIGQATEADMRTYNKIKHLPVIQRFREVVFKRCHIRYRQQIRDAAPQALEHCGKVAKEKGFDYLNPKYPKLDNYEVWPLGWDKCFHRCFLDKLDEGTGSAFPVLKLKAKLTSTDLFDPDLVPTQLKFAKEKWNECLEKVYEAMEKKINPSDEQINCGIAELHATCIHFTYPKNEPDCYKELNPIEIDKLGPPFSD